MERVGRATPSNKLLSYIPPTLHFFSSSIFYPYLFSSFFYIPFCPSHPFFYHHFSKIFAILFSFLLASFISPTTLQNVISSISSPPFQKNKFCKIYCKKYLSSKKYSNCLKTICPFPGQKIEQQQHHSLLRFISFIIYLFGRGPPCRILPSIYKTLY